MFYYSPSTKGFYREEIHGLNNIPEDCIEVTDEQHEQLFAEVNSNGGEICFADGELSVAQRVAIADWSIVRSLRNQKLAATDWTQLFDVPQALRDTWSEYRQALRDIPQTYADNIEAIVWPEAPTE